MWIYRSILALAGGSCLVILSAALTRTVASVAPIPAAASSADELPSAPAPLADPAAERCLEQALDAFKPDRISWLETAIWQKVQLPGCEYQADGYYRLAPGQRFRLEIHTHPAEGEGTIVSVSDGRELWHADRSGQGEWENVKHTNLSEVFAVMNGPAGSRLRDEFLQQPHFQGMTPLLRNLRCSMVWARSERLRQNGGERIHLVGVWAKEVALKHTLPDRSWPIALPRQCHLYLDGQTFWPQRVEWWGPTAAGGADRLLVQMEFRDPVFNHPMPEETCARLFVFQPGASVIEDDTARITAEMTKRAGELTPPSVAR
jgi:hypothetical protein